MNRTSLEVISAIGLLCPLVLVAQSGSTGSFSTDGQPTIRYESRTEPEQPSLAKGYSTGTANRNKRFQRFLHDRSTHEYFGYSMTLQKQSALEYTMTLGPLMLSPAEHPIADSDAHLLPSPEFPPPQTVRLGQKVAIELFDNPKTGQKIVDYVWLELQDCDAESQKADCWATLLTNADSELQRVLQKHQAREDGAALAQAQQSWEVYRDDSCRMISDRSKQFQCKLKLTRSRINDVRSIY